MKRWIIFGWGFLILFAIVSPCRARKRSGADDRVYWVKSLVRIADPVLTNLSRSTLRQNMPYESLSKDRSDFAHLEAVGRVICGIAPWLELGPDDTPEGRLRGQYIQLAVEGLKNAVNPESSDYLIFDKPYQPLVDAAFLAQGMLRAPRQLWGNLDEQSRLRMITEWKRSRKIKPWENNWLLFASMIEAALLEFTGECDTDRLFYGVNKFMDEWYKGDAMYGDGPVFHMDYYNSFVIHPMLTDLLIILRNHRMLEDRLCETQLKRHARYAEQLERFISPEGSYPVIGRSIVYRFGVFHALSHAALLKIIPGHISPSQIRCALTAVIHKQLKFKNNFDSEGWLKVGFTGAQIDMSESYINTGSLYLCTTVFLPLGLSPDDQFWTAPYTDWSGKRVWSGNGIGRDHALK